MCTLLLVFCKVMVCSPLSVRFGTIEMTAVIIIPKDMTIKCDQLKWGFERLLVWPPCD